MKNEMILATSTEHIQKVFSFKNAELNKFSASIAKIALDSVSRNIELAKILGRVLDTECYKEDGFSSVGDFAEKTFGIKRASAYQLASVGRRFFNSDTETAGKVVKMLKGQTGNLAELVNMSDEQIESAISENKINADSVQTELREVAKSVKPPKVINEKKARLSAVISHMTENGKIEVITSDSVIVDNVEILKAIGFTENDKIVKLYNLQQTVHVEGKEDKAKITGAEFLAYTIDCDYVARIACEYIEKPKAAKAQKAPTDYNMSEEERRELEEFRKWKAAQAAQKNK